MNFLDIPYPQPPWARVIFWIKGKRRSQFHLQTRNDSAATFQYWSIIGTTFIIMIPDLKRGLSATISRLLWVGDYFPRFVWHFGKMTSSVQWLFPVLLSPIWCKASVNSLCSRRFMNAWKGPVENTLDEIISGLKTDSYSFTSPLPWKRITLQEVFPSTILLSYMIPLPLQLNFDLRDPITPPHVSSIALNNILVTSGIFPKTTTTTAITYIWSVELSG